LNDEDPRQLRSGCPNSICASPIPPSSKRENSNVIVVKVNFFCVLFCFRNKTWSGTSVRQARGIQVFRTESSTRSTFRVGRRGEPLGWEPACERVGWPSY